jgi:hypothetical protein
MQRLFIHIRRQFCATISTVGALFLSPVSVLDFLVLAQGTHLPFPR